MKNSEKGAVPVLILVVALAVVLGVVLVQNPTNFFPKASKTKPPISSPITPTPTTTPTMQGRDGTWCTDSDGKDNYTVSGYCQDKQGTYQDSCQTASARDYYCTGTWNGKTYGKVHCAYLSSSCSASGKLCQNGACVNPPTPTPTSTPTPTPTFTPTPPQPTPTPQAAKRVFITSLTYSGNLGGLSGADAKCQERANSANLGGTWKAWLSDNLTSAASRLNHAIVPYIRLDGVTIANNWVDLTDNNIQNSITISEFKTPVLFTPGSPSSWAWTFSNPDGSIPSNTDPAKFSCSNWTTNITSSTGIIGAIDQINYRWSWDGGINCYNQVHLYCFEQ